VPLERQREKSSEVFRVEVGALNLVGEALVEMRQIFQRLRWIFCPIALQNESRF